MSDLSPLSRDSFAIAFHFLKRFGLYHLHLNVKIARTKFPKTRGKIKSLSMTVRPKLERFSRVSAHLFAPILNKHHELIDQDHPNNHSRNYEKNFLHFHLFALSVQFIRLGVGVVNVLIVRVRVAVLIDHMPRLDRWLFAIVKRSVRYRIFHSSFLVSVK